MMLQSPCPRLRKNTRIALMNYTSARPYRHPSPRVRRGAGGEVFKRDLVLILVAEMLILVAEILILVSEVLILVAESQTLISEVLILVAESETLVAESETLIAES